MRLERPNWREAEAYFKTHDLVLLSVGSIECHASINSQAFHYANSRLNRGYFSSFLYPIFSTGRSCASCLRRQCDRRSR